MARAGATFDDPALFEFFAACVTSTDRGVRASGGALLGLDRMDAAASPDGGGIPLERLR